MAVISKTTDNKERDASGAARPKILYIEDNDANWVIAETNLAGKYDLHRARHAHEAFKLMHEHEFALVLMDIELAGSALNGLDITRIMKGRYAGAIPIGIRPLTVRAPVIFVTAYTARYSKDDLLAVGGDEVIGKPVSFTSLKLAISRFLVRHILP